MDQLKPCPFCGSTEIEIILEHDEDVGRCWFVQCQHCYAQSPSVVETLRDKQKPEAAYKDITGAVAKAVAAWNRRAET